jgi:hypothetical protein
MTPIGVLLKPADVVGTKNENEKENENEKKRNPPSLAFDRLTIGPHSGTPARTCDELPPPARPSAGARKATCGRDSG